MSIRPHLKPVVSLVALVALATAVGTVEWRRRVERERIEAALALPSVCQRWPSLHMLGLDAAVEDELARVGLSESSPDERRRLMRSLRELGHDCPEPGKLVDARKTLRTFSSPCVDEAWRSDRCADALAAVFERERALRPELGRRLLSHATAWSEGRFSRTLVAALSGRDRGKVEGLVPAEHDAGTAALEAHLGMARLRVLARAWAMRAWPEALSEWGRGGNGAWHDALTFELGSPGVYFPHARDLQGNGVGQLLAARAGSCELVDRPGAATARVTRRPCKELVFDAPLRIGLPAGDSGERLAFDGRSGAFVRDSVTLDRSLPFAFRADGTLNPGATDGVIADAPTLYAPHTRTLPQWSVNALTGLLEALPLGTEEGTVPAAITSVEEWSSPWLRHRVKVAWLAPRGIAIASSESEGWLVLGGLDYQTVLPEREECALTAPYAKSTADMRARAVVPGDDGYFLLFGTYDDKRGDCEASAQEAGYFVVVCRKTGCSREDLPLNHRDI